MNIDKIDWKEAEAAFRDYRNTLDGKQTIPSYTYWLEHKLPEYLASLSSKEEAQPPQVSITALARSIPRHSLVKYKEGIYMIETNVKGRKVLLVPKEGEHGYELPDDTRMEIYQYPAQCAQTMLNSYPKLVEALKGLYNFNSGKEGYLDILLNDAEDALKAAEQTKD